MKEKNRKILSDLHNELISLKNSENRKSNIEGEKSRIFNTVGIIYFEEGQYKEALIYYKKSLKIHKDYFPENHPFIVANLQGIANVYFEQRNYEMTLKTLDIVLEMRKAENVIEYIGTTLQNMGIVYDMQGNYDKALNCCKQSLKVFVQKYSEKDAIIAPLYDNIATVYYHKKKYRMSLEYSQKSMSINSSLKKILDVAKTKINIGLVFNQQKKYEEALEYFENALETYKNTLPKNHLDIAGAYNNIGLVHYNEGKYDDALDNYEKTLEIFKLEDHPIKAIVLKNIGNVLEKQKKYEDVLNNYTEAMEINKKILGESHSDTKAILLDINLMKMFLLVKSKESNSNVTSMELEFNSRNQSSMNLGNIRNSYASFLNKIKYLFN